MASKTVSVLAHKPMSKSEIAIALGKAKVSGQIERLVAQLLRSGLIERTTPGKPLSRLQRYRLTEQGRAVLQRLKL